ncbi:NOTCH1 [Mytilus edulis]|uniref:NOTCH1 n=1 Tax=Mytilus edulis TaxID=6550 RepID=A0A8S3RYW7_MYTED|nr:NOTCH1 [Mytilus edulis]
MKLCSIRKYVSNTGHEWFDLGCSSQKVEYNIVNDIFVILRGRCIPIISVPVLGKRHVSTKTSSKFKKEAKSEKPSQTFRSTTETVVCEKCCTTDQCNARLLCESLDCDPNPCTHGVCKSSLRGYSCACHQGYYGSICDKNCDPDPCVHGICKSSLQGYHCTCQYGYDGSKCDQYCDPNPCVHGVCKSTLQGYSCTCESGYQGSKCDKYCDPNPCIHGVCSNSFRGYTLKCHHDYERN